MRILASILVLVGALDLFLKFIELMELESEFVFPYWDAVNPIYRILVYLGIAFGVIWTFYENKKESISIALQNYAQQFVRIWLAFMIGGYGFAKVLKTQFQVPEHIKDIPMGEQHPFWLTWYYFGFSREYALILAAVEIIGPILLLFRKTRLLGAVFLFPAMVNVLLINKYYHINPDAFLASIFFTLGVLYLLLLDFPILKATFLSFKSDLNIQSYGKTILKNVVRLSIIVTSFGLIWLYAHDKEPNQKFLRGVWEVESTKNTGDSILAKVYFEYHPKGEAILLFNYNPKKEFV
jgi:hypothetical protein